MDNVKDSVAETIDYINQVEKEIMFSFEQNNKKSLLDKVIQDLCMTLNLEQDTILNESNRNKCKSADFEESNLNSRDQFQFEKCGLLKISSKSSSSELSFDIDKQSNYRYSFYDNSNLLLVHLTPSYLIDESMTKLSSSMQVVENELESIQQTHCGLILPPYVEDALIHLFKFGLTSTGIFRKSGVKSRINSLKEQLINGENIEFNSLCVYDVADLVKTWLRDLKPHLITKEMVYAFKNDKDNFSLWNCGDSHRYVLFIILKFLSLVSSYSKQNQMNTHNLAICFTPSLCDCETEDQISNAQKCLEYCIDNQNSLFYITVNKTLNQTKCLNQHVSEIVVNASAQDILNRILYERHLIDPLINKWNIKSQSENFDKIEYNLCFSSFLPSKCLVLQRNWSTINKTTLILNEKGDLLKSIWTLESIGKGQTRVVHDLSLDLRGFSTIWYDKVFSVIHEKQLKQIATSFEFTNLEEQMVISKV